MAAGLDSVNQSELVNSSSTQSILPQQEFKFRDTSILTPCNHKCVNICLNQVQEYPTCNKVYGPNKLKSYNLTVLPFVDPKETSRRLSPRFSPRQDIIAT